MLRLYKFGNVTSSIYKLSYQKSHQTRSDLENECNNGNLVFLYFGKDD